MSHPLSYLSGPSAHQASVVPLLWWTIGTSVVVSAVVTGLLIAALLRPKGNVADAPDDRGSGTGLRWVWIAVGISIVPLLVTLVWTVAVLAHVGPVPRNPRLTIDVAARQWWWDAAYSGDRPDQRFRTANEIHIPTGEKVLLRLTSPDVIHSFWVPRLAGKMDLIPGRTNATWIEADKPGRYRGQCGEFCGAQHAHMAFELVADSPEQFEVWRRAQLQTAPPPTNPSQAHGLAVVEYRCALCHAVRGTRAGAVSGPDLTHLKSRQWIAAGTLPNTRGALAGWIENPQAAKPNSLMPDQALSASELNDLTAYLETLK